MTLPLTGAGSGTSGVPADALLDDDGVTALADDDGTTILLATDG